MCDDDRVFAFLSSVIWAVLTSIDSKNNSTARATRKYIIKQFRKLEEKTAILYFRYQNYLLVNKLLAI